jgi:hypothetical protein
MSSATLSYEQINVTTKTTTSAVVPYVNSTTQLGYFYVQTPFDNTEWNSVNTFLQTPYTDFVDTSSNSCLKINVAGIYRLTCSIDFVPTVVSDGNQNTIKFAFGTQQLIGEMPGGLLGGNIPTGMYSLSSNNITSPGIINWNTNAFCDGNPNPSEYSLYSLSPSTEPNQGYLIYNFYSKNNNSGDQYPGICSTQLTFSVSTIPSPIYLNICGSYNVSTITIGNSPFVLELLNTYPSQVLI